MLPLEGGPFEPTSLLLATCSLAERAGLPSKMTRYIELTQGKARPRRILFATKDSIFGRGAGRSTALKAS